MKMGIILEKDGVPIREIRNYYQRKDMNHEQ
jgi:hypothetical protein